MDDNMKSIRPDTNGKEPETASTTSLLRKRKAEDGAITGEASTTSPITSRLAQLQQEGAQSKGKSRIGLYIGIGGGVLLIAVAIILIGGSGFSGITGSGGIFGGSAASDDPNLVNARSGQPVPPPAATPNQPEAQPVAVPADIQAQPGAPVGGSAAVPVTTAGGPMPAPAPPPAPAPAPVVRTVTPAPAPAPAPTRAATPTPTAMPPRVAMDAPSMSGSSPSRSTTSAAMPAGASGAVVEGALVSPEECSQQPVPIGSPKANMPMRARNMKQKAGQVIIRYLVDERGNVLQTKVISENPPNCDFGMEAQKALMSLKFQPAVKGGVKVKVWKTMNLKIQ